MWVSNIQKAIDYIEKHLTENINICDIVYEANSSPFQFQRVFTILCGHTIADYIRMRRLSLAAVDLMNKENKVIDVAFKYGYETPESFTRAFKNFHEILPTEVRKGANVKNFSKISVKLVLEGGNKMDYRIEKMPSFKVLCKRTNVAKPMDASPNEIVNFWAKSKEDGTTQKIIDAIKIRKETDDKLFGLLGICFSKDLDANHFPYGIGITWDSDKAIDGLEVVEIPAYTYAVFTCKGPLPQSFQDTYKKICTEFFPQNPKYEYAYGIEIEKYPSDDVSNKDYSCEIWIAVNEK